MTRSGYSANSDVENIKIVDADTGAYVGSIGSLNVDNRAMITFIPSLVIKAGTTRTFYIEAGIKDGTGASKTVKLGIASKDDITSDASAVNGTFPIMGNSMTTVSLDIGSLTVSEDGTTVDSQPNVGDTDVTVLKWKAVAGSTEPVTIETVTVKRTGTADASDTKNIELYDVTDGKSLGTVENWNSEDKATWSNLNIVVDKGKTHRFKIMLDVVGGVSSSAKTINVDLIDGSDVLVSAKGDTYGFYITPSYDSSWDGQATTSQTIQSGSLTITKASDTPATGNIAAGDNVKLGVFDFEVKGEDVKVSALKVKAASDTSGTALSSGGFADSDITNVALYDANGNIVAGPTTLSSDEASFTDTFIVPVGTHEYTVEATIADSASTGDSIAMGIETPGSSITATGMTSNDTITATPSTTVYANKMTVAGPSLTVTTLPSPASRDIPAPTSDFVFATFSLDASSSGEDINVSSITITDSTDQAGYINNAEIWADLDNGTSARGDIYETKISDTEQPSGTGNSDTTTYTLNKTLTIPKGTFRKIALVADLDSSATSSHTFSIESDGITAIGANTGENASVTYNTGSKQTIGVGSSVLTVTKDSSSPSSNIVIGGDKGINLGVFRLAASNVEDLDLDQITVYSANGSYVDTYHFYDGDKEIGSIPGGNSTATWVVPDKTLTIPANGHKEITVKADLYPVDGTTITNGSTITASLSDVEATGLSSGKSLYGENSSGVTVDSNHLVDANQMTIYKSRPYFAKDSDSPSGDLYPSSNEKIAVFDVKADAGEDITFDNSISSQLVMKVDAQVTDTATGYITFTLKDDDGNVLGVDSVNFGSSLTMSGKPATFDSTNSWGGTGSGTTTYSLTIPAGQTKKITVYADTTDFEDSGDSIQVYLDDNSNDNCIFGIDGVGAYSEGQKIFKGDIYAGSFTKP